jgi:hypothetical protein
LPETIRLICPKCKYEHVEKDKRKMIINGGYIHRDLIKFEKKILSYQIGALASQWRSLGWE